MEHQGLISRVQSETDKRKTLLFLTEKAHTLNKDYLQVLAYMLRFDAMKGYYLYPEAEGADDLQLWLNKGSTYEANVVPRDDICIIKHGLKIPIDAENYESFVSKMQVSESEFRQVFIG